MFLLIQLLTCWTLVFGAVESENERYNEADGPPSTGWEQATKFFTRDRKSVSARVGDSDIDTGGNRLIFIDNVTFVNNSSNDKHGNEGQWGLSAGLEWDREYVAQGFYIDYSRFDSKKNEKDDQKFTVLTGLIFPRLETQFPLYLRGALGLGYFTGDFANDTLTVDYNLYTGFRVFTHSGMLFNIEMGSKNYTRIFQSSYLNSFVLNSGLAFVF